MYLRCGFIVSLNIILVVSIRVMIFAHGFHQEGKYVRCLSVRLLINLYVDFVIIEKLFVLLKLYFLLSISKRLLNKTPTLWNGPQLRVAFWGGIYLLLLDCDNFFVSV